MDHRQERGAGTVDMTEGQIGKALLLFTAPILLGNLFQLLYHASDYSDEEEFYEEHWDDFFDFEDADTYWQEHH